MYDVNLERLKTALEHIDAVLEITKNGISQALQEKLRDKPAILMHLQACYQNFEKLKKHDFDLSLILDENELRNFKGSRNFIAHDYDGVDLGMVENAIRCRLPHIRKNILTILNSKN